MYYLEFIILATVIPLVTLIWNKFVKNQNDIIMENNREFDENTPYKKFLPKITVNYIWFYVLGIFAIFIMSRVHLCKHKTPNEYKHQEVVFENDYIQSDGNNYLMYIDNKLEYIPISSVNIHVDESVSTPRIENYYYRWIKKAVPKHKEYFLFNRKVDRVGEWKETGCGCGGDYNLIVDRQYEIKNITE